MKSLRFKIASEPWEFEQIHRLNYRTFVEEIPQHQPNPVRTLVDKFHDHNTYVICVRHREVVGMIAFRGERPFSLDAKLEVVDAFLPHGRKICEIRLLAVGPEFRNGKVFGGLLREAASYGRQLGFDLAIISGTVRQRKLYQHLGFVSFGPLVGTPEAQFQPMYLTLESFCDSCPHLARSDTNAMSNGGISTYPGL